MEAQWKFREDVVRMLPVMGAQKGKGLRGLFDPHLHGLREPRQPVQQFSENARPGTQGRFHGIATADVGA